MIEITSEIVRELLHYDPDAGVFTWRKRGRKWFRTDHSFTVWNTRFAGVRAGNTGPSNGTYLSRKIGLFGRLRCEHRLAWMWMTDDPLPPQIDHINRNPTDNRWCNLRASSYEHNSRNRSMYSNNASGVTGVKWHKPSKKWLACVDHKGKRHNLGSFTSIDEASVAVKDFRASLGFDPTHGAASALC